MALKINKPGLTINDASYNALYVELEPFVELHYDRVSVNTKCYDFEDVSLYGLTGYWDASLRWDPSTSYEVDVWDVSTVIDASGNTIDVSILDSSTVIVPAGWTDISVWIPPIEHIIPKGWKRFNPMKFDFEEEASTNLESWAAIKAKRELTSQKAVPYEYMAYEDDIYDLDPSSGDPILDPCTNQPILLHAKGELIKKENGTYLFYTKVLDRFCEAEDVSIL
jgi:hypothetical protein